jgi:outer membrane receptor protein involved in Fe transport
MPARLARNVGPATNFDPKFVGTGNTFGWEADTITNRASVSDTVSTGLEIEAVWNPTRNWRIAVNVAKNEAVKANVAVEELAFANEWIANLQSMYDGSLLRGWRNPPTESATLLGQYRNESVSDIETAAALSGTRSPEIRKWRANLVTRYEFASGPLRGFSVGGAVRWQDKLGIGYPFLLDASGNDVADLSNPYEGPDELQVDLSLGYRRRLEIFGARIDWNIGLNIRNLIASDDLIPIHANADGSYGTVRIPPDRIWSISNSFRF